MSQQTNGPILVLDACSSELQVGLFQREAWLARASVEGEVLATLFSTVEELFEKTGLGVGDLAGHMMASGPGSLLGLRITAIALEGWRRLGPQPPPPLWTYRASALAAASLSPSRQLSSPCHFLAAFRRTRWSVYSTDGLGESGRAGHSRTPTLSGTAEPSGTWQVLDTEELEALPGTLLTLPLGRLQVTTPARAIAIPYSIEDIPRRFHHEESSTLFIRVERPEIFLPETPQFARWSGQTHGSATAPK